MEEPSSEDVASIYDDLMCQGDLGLVIHNLQTRNKQLQLHVTSLEEDIRKLCDKITEMKQTQENLSRNISELFKTAKSEVQRKDRIIAELQSKLDDMIFKRNTAPTNFGVKRQREEQCPPEEMLKKSRNVVHSREQKKDNCARDSEMSKNEHYNKDKKNDCERNKNYKSSDSNDHMKVRNDSRIEERRLDSRERSSRYDGDSRRSSNLRDRGYRSDNRNNSSRDYNDKDRKMSREKDHKGGRFGESREPKYKNGRLRNDRFNRDKESRSDGREDIRRSRELKNEPRFSPIESTRSTPEPSPRLTECLNVSKEEGELSDAEEEKKVSQFDKEKSTNDYGKQRSKINRVSVDIKKNPPGDNMKSFNVSEFIDKQQNLNNKKDAEMKHFQRRTNIKELDSNNMEDVESFAQNDENEKNKNSKDNKLITKKEENMHTIQIKEEHTDKGSQPAEKFEDSVSSINKDCIKKKGNLENNELKTEKITIISQVVLSEAKNENVVSDLPIKAESEKGRKIGSSTKDVTGIRHSREIEVQKIDRPIRECGVPRNLTGELNINLKKSRPKQVEKEQESLSEKTERVQKKISSLFDTPMKECKQCPENSIPFKENFGLTHDGDIPELEFEKLDSKEISSNQSVVGLKETLTPVSEFQIFKTNLPSLEKSNSVSIQFQTNISNVTMKSIEVLTVEKTESKKINTGNKKKIVEDCTDHKFDTDVKTVIGEGYSDDKLSVEVLKKHNLEDIVNIRQPVIKNENKGYGTTGDMCNISLDLLNTNLAVYKVEDFPNLSAFSESKDMPNILLPPVNRVSPRKIVEKDHEKSKLSDFGNILKEPNTLNVQTEQKVVLRENNTGESRSIVSLKANEVGNISTNALVSPSSGDARRKRKRCVIKWAE